MYVVAGPELFLALSAFVRCMNLIQVLEKRIILLTQNIDMRKIIRYFKFLYYRKSFFSCQEDRILDSTLTERYCRMQAYKNSSPTKYTEMLRYAKFLATLYFEYNKIRFDRRRLGW